MSVELYGDLSLGACGFHRLRYLFFCGVSIQGVCVCGCLGVCVGGMAIKELEGGRSTGLCVCV